MNIHSLEKLPPSTVYAPLHPKTYIAEIASSLYNTEPTYKLLLSPVWVTDGSFQVISSDVGVYSKTPKLWCKCRTQLLGHPQCSCHWGSRGEHDCRAEASSWHVRFWPLEVQFVETLQDEKALMRSLQLSCWAWHVWRLVMPPPLWCRSQMMANECLFWVDVLWWKLWWRICTLEVYSV